MSPMKSLTLSLVLLSCLSLASCGGGSGGDTSTPTLTPQTSEVINGITVPPEPDPTVNNATLAGVDSNNNGVRDDAERKIATDFGDNPAKYQDIFMNAKTEQALIINPSDENVGLYKKAVACSTLHKNLSTREMDNITYFNLNTEERKKSYMMALVGSTTIPSDEACQ